MHRSDRSGAELPFTRINFEENGANSSTDTMQEPIICTLFFQIYYALRIGKAILRDSYSAPPYAFAFGGFHTFTLCIFIIFLMHQHMGILFQLIH